MDASQVDKEIDGLFEELDALLKNREVESSLAARGINTSLAMVAADGLRAYLKGEKARAAEDLGTAAEEIEHRMEAAREAAKEEARRKPS